MNILRLMVLAIQGELTLEMFWTGLFCLPVVALFTVIGKRFPPPFSDNTMRRLAFLLLIVIGISLVLGA